MIHNNVFYYLLHISSIDKLLYSRHQREFSLNCFHILDWKFPEQIEFDWQIRIFVCVLTLNLLLCISGSQWNTL